MFIAVLLTNLLPVPKTTSFFFFLFFFINHKTTSVFGLWGSTYHLSYLPLDKIVDDIFKCIFVNGKFDILINFSLKFVPKGPIDIKAAMVQIMAWHRTGDKPLPEPMLTQFTDAIMQHYGEMSSVELILGTIKPLVYDTSLSNKIVDHSEVVGASPVGAAPINSSFST